MLWVVGLSHIAMNGIIDVSYIGHQFIFLQTYNTFSSLKIDLVSLTIILIYGKCMFSFLLV